MMYMICGACLSGVEVSLETQNELLDLAAQHLGNISAEEALEPVEVLRGLHNSVYAFSGSPCYTFQINACYNCKLSTLLAHNFSTPLF